MPQDDSRPALPGAPDLAAARESFAAFCRTIAALRDPKDGCPWDLQQDHESLRPFMIEEAYEAAAAMVQGESPALCEELGDVLLQVVLNSQVAHDAGTFSIVDVIEAIDAKMRRRHPHVFGTPEEKQEAISSDKVRSNWEAIKAGEKAARSGDKTAPKGFFAEAEGKGPASHQALKIGKLAAKINFDWLQPGEVFDQVRSEVDEVGEALAQGKGKADLAEEIGDVYFSLAQLCRHLGFDPEIVALDANRKFMRRFGRLEDLAASRGQVVTRATRDELEALWRDVKALER